MQVKDQDVIEQEVVDETDGTEADIDNLDEFEYDEEGNIIIPEVVDDEQDEDDEATDDSDDDSANPDQQDESQEHSQGTNDDGQTEEPDVNQPDDKDVKIAELQKKGAEKDALILDALKALGIESDDPTSGLERFLAETNGQSIEDYRKEKDEAAKVAEARQLLQRTEFEKTMKADLDEIHRSFPETRNITRIDQIENFAEFGALRDKGLTATQAYAAVNIDSVKKNVATSVKQQSLNDTKSHLQSAVPKSAKDTTIPMSRKDLAYWQDLFPEKSEKEIRELFQEVSKKMN